MRNVVFESGDIVVVETNSSFSIRLKSESGYRVLSSRAHSAKLENESERYEKKRRSALDDAVYIAQALAAHARNRCVDCKPCICGGDGIETGSESPT